MHNRQKYCLQSAQASLNGVIFLLFTLSLSVSVSQAATTESYSQVRQLAQLAEYIGVDYAEAVSHGRVINDNEYLEMIEFSHLIVDLSSLKLDGTASLTELTGQARALQRAVQNKEDSEKVRQLSVSFRSLLLDLIPQSLLPKRLLQEEAIRSVFETNCASCHGLSGDGRGSLAEQFDPAPTDFTDKERAVNRSVLGLYDAISNGIDNTVMPAFVQLNDQQRWSLAFYVGGLAFQHNAISSSEEPSITLQGV